MGHSSYNKKGVEEIYTTPLSLGVFEGRVFLYDNAEKIKIRKNSILLTMADERLSNKTIRKYDGIILSGGHMMSKTAIIARRFGIPCIAITTGLDKLQRYTDKLTIDCNKGQLYYKKRPESTILPYLGIDLNLETIKPYHINESGKVSIFSWLDFLKSPSDYVLIKQTDKYVIFYCTKQFCARSSTTRAIKEVFGRNAFYGGIDLFDNYTSILFGIYTEPRFKSLYAKLKNCNRTPLQMLRFFDYCVYGVKRELDLAERIIKDFKTSEEKDLERIRLAFRAVNNSAIYVTFGNELIPAMFLRKVQTDFDRNPLPGKDFLSFLSDIDSNNILNTKRMSKSYTTSNIGRAISLYLRLSKCKLDFEKFTQHSRRSNLWWAVTRIFKEATGHKSTEFLGEYGSGYKLETFLSDLQKKTDKARHHVDNL